MRPPRRGSSTIPSASESWTFRATSCCWAPSWRLRSSRRRVSSWAAISRWRDAAARRAARAGRRSAARSGARDRPGRPRSASSFSSVGVSVSFGGLVTDRAPNSSPWWRTATADVTPAIQGTSGRRAARLGGFEVSTATTTPAAARADLEPDVRALGGGALGEDARHPRQQDVGRRRLRHALGELRQHLVRRGPLAVDEAVGEALHPLLHRLEGDGDDAGGDDRQPEVLGLGLAEQGADRRPRRRRRRAVTNPASTEYTRVRLMTLSMSHSR